MEGWSKYSWWVASSYSIICYINELLIRSWFIIFGIWSTTGMSKHTPIGTYTYMCKKSDYSTSPYCGWYLVWSADVSFSFWRRVLATSWPAVLGDEMTRATSWPDETDVNGENKIYNFVYINIYIHKISVIKWTLYFRDASRGFNQQVVSG